MKKGMNLK
jgi:hypothetical protein